MSKRLQVLLPDGEYGTLRRIAKQRGVTVAEWVRQLIRHGNRAEATGDVERKLAAVRLAVTHDAPAPDIDQMLAEIESGYVRPLEDE